RRVVDDGRPHVRLLHVVLGLPQRVVIVDVGARLAVQPVDAALEEGFGLGGREEFLPLRLVRTLEGDVAVVGPVALQVWMAVAGAGRVPPDGALTGQTGGPQGDERGGKQSGKATAHFHRDSTVDPGPRRSTWI